MPKAVIPVLLLLFAPCASAAEPLALSTMNMGIFAKGGGRENYAFFLEDGTGIHQYQKQDAPAVVKYFSAKKNPVREFALLSWTGPFAGDDDREDMQAIADALRKRHIDFCIVDSRLLYQRESPDKPESALCLMRDIRPRGDAPEHHYFLGYRYLGAGETGCKALLEEAPKLEVKQLLVACDPRFDAKDIARVCRERYAAIFPSGRVAYINPANEVFLQKHDPYSGEDRQFTWK